MTKLKLDLSIRKNIRLKKDEHDMLEFLAFHLDMTQTHVIVSLINKEYYRLLAEKESSLKKNVTK